MQTLIALKNITAGYENTPVLHNIDLTIGEGDFIGIIGPNGNADIVVMDKDLAKHMYRDYRSQRRRQNHPASGDPRIIKTLQRRNHLPRFQTKPFRLSSPKQPVRSALSHKRDGSGLVGADVQQRFV